jgi:osmoprotectant transport system permease protein
VILGDVWDWFTMGAHWRGPDGVPTRIGEHLVLSGISLGIALAVAVPVAVVLGHLGRGGFLAINVSNIGRAVPSLALLVFVAQVFHTIGSAPAIVALIALAIPPVVTNTYVGMREVDPDVVEAARGMGLSGWQMVRGVEVPLAIPLIMAGVRTAAVQVVATATLAALVASGGLGRYIVDGFAEQRYAEVYAGAILVALLALLTEFCGGLVQRALSPAPVRRRRAVLTPPEPGAGTANPVEVAGTR